jgi:hypothetical protein
VSSLLMFLISCGDTSLRGAELTGERVGQSRADQYLPVLPSDCEVTLTHGAREGESMLSALRRVNGRLEAQNDRIDRCARFYNDLRIGGPR